MPKPLENLTVHAFRGLRELELPNLGSINLFVGPNNSGKTSVLEAIGTFCRPLDALEWVRAARSREIKSTRYPIRESFRWLFPQDHGRSEAELFYGEAAVSATGGTFPVRESKAICEEMVSFAEAEPEPSDESDDELEESGFSLSLGPGETIVTELRLTASVTPEQRLQFGADPSDGRLSRRFDIWSHSRFTKPDGAPVPELAVGTVSSFAHRVEQLQVGQLTALTLGRHKTKVVEVLKLFDEHVADLEILAREGSRPAVYLRHDRLGLVPLSTCGDGMRRALVIAMSLISVEHGALLVDEIETAIHASALGAVFEWLVRACFEFDVQLFATTHSLEAVDAMLCEGKVDLGEVTGFHLESAPDRSMARRFPGDLLWQLREERGLDVR